jgi:hypothetical protein
MSLLLPSARGEALCAAVLAAPRAAAGVKSLASSLLGLVAHLARDAAAARRRFQFAVDVCGGETRAVSKWALMHLPMYLFEGLGGPAEPQRAERLLAAGCENEVGPCLELAAQRATAAGRMDVAAGLWRRAAAQSMVLSWAVVHGVSFEDAQAAIGGEEAGLLRGLRASGIGGQGSAGQLGAMVRSTPQELVDRLMLVCSCCGRVGSACEPDAAAAGAAAAAAPAAAAAAAAGGAAEGAPNTPAQDAVLHFLGAFATEEIAAGRVSEGGAAGSGGGGGGGGALGPASAAAMRRVLAECARERGPAVLLFYCGRCKRAMYCSEACQARAWAEHKPSCRAPEGGSEQ